MPLFCRVLQLCVLQPLLLLLPPAHVGEACVACITRQASIASIASTTTPPPPPPESVTPPSHPCTPQPMPACVVWLYV